MVIFIVDLNHDLVSSLGDNNQTRQKPPIGDFNLLGYYHQSVILAMWTTITDGATPWYLHVRKLLRAVHDGTKLMKTL